MSLTTQQKELIAKLADGGAEPQRDTVVALLTEVFEIGNAVRSIATSLQAISHRQQEFD